MLQSLQDPQSVNGLKVLATTEWKSPTEVLSEFESATGEKAVWKSVSPQEWRSALPSQLPEAAKSALTANMVWMADFGYFGMGAEETQTEHDRFRDGKRLKTWMDFLTDNEPMSRSRWAHGSAN